MEVATKEYKNRFARYPKKAAFRIMVFSFLYLFYFKNHKYLLKKNITQDGEFLSVAFFLEGGFGDYLLFANWLQYFRDYFQNEKIHIYIGYGRKMIHSILKESDRMTLMDVSIGNINFEDFDLCYQFSFCPILKYSNDQRIKKVSASIYHYVELSKKYLEENRLIIDNEPYLNGWADYLSVVKGIRRYQAGDIYHFFGIQEKFIFPVTIAEKEETYLKEIELLAQPFVVVHRGWDVAYKRPHVKAWSENSCGDLVIKLKEKFPDFKIVVFGESRAQSCETVGADLDLVGKTTLEQVKILLKNARLLIDNEGGMVHLRHALQGGKSIVLFGPTSEEFFGYSENENLRGNGCQYSCEWSSSVWQFTCVRGFEEPPCMNSINTEMILKAAERILR